MHHFTQADLLASLAAVGLYPLLLVIPGYVIGWWSGIFDFRRRTPAFRFTLSVPLSIAICPILVYLTGRFASLRATAAVLAVGWICFAVILVRQKQRWPRFPRTAYWIILGWLALTLFTNVDMQLGARNYYPNSAFDYSVRSEFIHSIGTTGIPPGNPFFYPGHTVFLRYHYFWLALPGLVYRASGYAIAPRAAWIGGVFWAGLGMMCLIAVAFRVFWQHGKAAFSRRAIAGVLLLGVTGLDIVPTAFLWLLRAAGIVPAVMPSVEWWNEQVDGFEFTALWQAHYLAGLVACLMAFLLIQEGSRQTSPRRQAWYAVLAGVALATAVGTAIYVALVFGIYLTLWTAIVAARRWWRQFAVLAMTGAIGMALVLPYALSLRVAGGPSPSAGGAVSGGGGPPLELWMRPFYPVESVLKGMGHGGVWTLRLADTLMLPLNYFLELGFFFVTGVAWWRKRRAARTPLEPAELALAVLMATSIAICTLVRSSVIGNNDLGWRGFLPAQFGLLLWSVDILFDRPRPRWLPTLIVLGALGSAYDIAITRFYPVMVDAGIVRTLAWMSPDRQFGQRNYAAREAYEWIARSTPPQAVVQYDPHVELQDTSALLYSNRQIAAGGPGCFAVFGGDPSPCPGLMAELERLYPVKGAPAVASREAACRNLPVDILVAKDTDAVWADPHAWVWNEAPIFANRYFRVFGCRAAELSGPHRAAAQGTSTR